MRGLEGALCNLGLAPAGVTGDVLDRTAVTIAGRKIHLRECAGGSERRVDRTQLFDDIGPVECRKLHEAGDDIAHRDVRRALPLQFLGDDDVERQPIRMERVLEPLNRWRDVWVAVAQSLHKLHGELAGQRCAGKRAEHRFDRLADSGRRSKQAVGERVGRLALESAADDAVGRAPQVLDQHDAQHARQGP